LRIAPEDFKVEEVLGFEPDGSGSHLLLRVEKRGANTHWVAADLARRAGVPSRDVGYAGHKDRDAVTVQWFSLPLPGNADPGPLETLSGPGYRALSASRHGRKLRPGSHRSNRFDIVVRDLVGEPARLEKQLQRIASGGVPNYFGPQRFGQNGVNLACARDWAATGRGPRQRPRRGFALSAARAWLFNRVLALRVRRGDWDRLLAGEAAMLDKSRSYFQAESLDAELERRCLSLDVHPSGPLWGAGPSPASAAALEVEASATGEETELCGLLVAQGLKHERRSLRLRVEALDWQLEANSLRLRFELPRGTFATAVLHELVKDAWEG
jgi:tRNA pseudouridine13 synthase